MPPGRRGHELSRGFQTEGQQRQALTEIVVQFRSEALALFFLSIDQPPAKPGLLVPRQP